MTTQRRSCTATRISVALALWVAVAVEANRWSQLSTAPTARSYHTSVWSDVANGMYVFAGNGGSSWYNGGSQHNDFHFYNRQANRWSQLSPIGTVPTARSGHTAVWCDVADGMYVFGGSRGGHALNDFHFYERKAEQAKQEVAKAEEKKKVVVSKAQELTKKKKTFKTQAVERKAPVPPDIEGMLAKLEAEVEKVRGPCEEVCAQEQKLLAKEQKLKLQIEKRSEEVKAMRDGPSSPASPSKEEHGPQSKVRATESTNARLRGEDEGKRLGYRARIAEDPLVPRHVHLYGDLSARREHLAELQQRNAEDEARDILARLPRLTDEEKEELNRHRPQSQVPVWFMRDEDIRVKAALAAQSAVELDRVLQESQERMQVLKKDLERHGHTLAQGFSETAELLVEGPRRYAQAMQPQDEAIRSELLAALEIHQECSTRAEDVWRLAEAGCDVGSKENELQLEASACLAHEEDLAEACRAIYKVAQVTKLPEARSFEQYWLRAEKKFKSSALPWQRAMDAAEQLDAERVSKEKLSNLLDLELKKKLLLEAELVAPPEAKRALASLRYLARQELSHRGTDRMLT